MTTKVKIECPDKSHWHVEVIAEQFVKGSSLATPDDWVRVGSVVLKQGESHETHVYDSRRLVITEVEPQKI